jgi:ATP-binding cassette subfamily B multidrug efflux pump
MACPGRTILISQRVSLFRWLETRIPFERGFDDSREPPTDTLGFLWFHLTEIRNWLALIFATSLAFSVFEAAIFLAIGWGIDALTATHRRDDGIDNIVYVMIISVALIRPLLFFMSHVSVDQIVVPSLAARVRWRSHLHTIKQPISYFLGQHTGKITNRIIQSGDAVRGATVEIFDNLSYVIVFCTITSFYLIYLHPYYIASFLIWCVCFALIIRGFIANARTAAHANAAARSAFSGHVVDIYNNVLTVKLFNRTGDESNKFKEELTGWKLRHQALTRIATLSTTLLECANSCLIVSFALISVHLWQLGMVTEGGIAATLGLMLRIIGMSGWIMFLFKGLFDAVGTVRDSMDTIPRHSPPSDQLPKFSFSRGQIIFHEVEFAYHHDRPLMKDFTLRIDGGEKVGIVGQSGAGKSTLLDLVLGLHRPAKGDVQIDAQSVAATDRESLWRSITLVSNQVGLLSRSVRDNICLGRPYANQEEIDAAVKLARADSFIPFLVDADGRTGYETHIGSAGHNLSAGQRQRIMLARAFLRGSPIVLLDEATSALDPLLEAEVTNNLLTWLRSRTAIVVSHRLSTLVSFDRILVLHQGTIIEEGSHEELLSRDGQYAKLWRHQNSSLPVSE